MSSKGPDDEVTFGFELTEKGVSGKAKGRTLGIFHSWLGSALAPMIARNDRAAARERLLGALEKQAINQLGAEAIERLRSDTTSVDALLEAISLPGIARREENAREVFRKAIEDLRTNPPSERQSGAGADELTPEIADRLELYASGATTDEIRERWGRVLAAEIRQPGTFSLKVLRIIDELDSSLPAVFETLATHRCGDLIPRCLTGKLDYRDQINLVDGGLLHDPGGSGRYQMRYLVEGKFDDEPVWLISFGNAVVGIPMESAANLANGSDRPLIMNEGKPALPTYLLTEAGTAIINILPPVDNANRYLTLLREKVPRARLFKRSSDESPWVEHDILPGQPKKLDDIQG